MSQAPEYFEEALDNLLAEVREMFLRKRKAYGYQNLIAFGEFGIMVRTYDKIERLRNLTATGNNPPEETIDDTWADIMGYGIAASIFRRGQIALPDASGLEKAEPFDFTKAVMPIKGNDDVLTYDTKVTLSNAYAAEYDTKVTLNND